MKTNIYNLIILDESGSMYNAWTQTISGCNETINTIRAAQNQYADTQDHYVSIFAFQSEGDRPSRYLIKNMPIANVHHIDQNMYEPNGCTPLYDAVGATLVDLKATVKEKELAIGSVTIITDGMENASRHYSHKQVADMISALKEMGWNFNFIGANIDVEYTAQSLNIDNRMAFANDEAGTREMFEKERKGRGSYYGRMHRANLYRLAPRSAEEREKWYNDMKNAEKGYFDEEEEEGK